MLRTKCIKAPIESSDGLRISVMSRHTLNDGVTPDVDIKDGVFDEWLRDLAPPEKLIGSYYKRGLSWNEFEQRYLEFLDNDETYQIVKLLGSTALNQNLTIMCIEESPELCHRRLIAEKCQLLIPELVTIIS